jgi:hypothetical protein
VSFYGATAKEAEDERLQALADQATRIIFSDPDQLTSWSYMCTQPAVFHFDGVLGEEPEVEVALA